MYILISNAKDLKENESEMNIYLWIFENLSLSSNKAEKDIEFTKVA